ncbi:hypothetical protein V6N11_071402 [Hibiscus sabdariffa]|uniref:Uncharacterized protein n=1 Tax=Hibiscus sabdariffa TaxID=183260 RepID=A0ABR2U017_9ROSI
MFMGNISNQMHWQGVWKSFDRHEREIEGLNGFWLYGSRVTVAFAVRCQCGMVDESSESADIMEEGCDARLVAPAVVSTARTVQEQEDMGDTNKEVLGRVADEVTGMVRREETTITQRMEGDRVRWGMGDAAVFETGLDSALNRDRDVILNSNSDFDKNLTVIPIEIADTIPIHLVVPQITQSPPEVVVSGGIIERSGGHSTVGFTSGGGNGWS